MEIQVNYVIFTILAPFLFPSPMYYITDELDPDGENGFKNRGRYVSFNFFCINILRLIFSHKVESDWPALRKNL